MKASVARDKVDGASLALLAIHDEIKHGNGIQAEFPYPHNWNAYVVVDLLDEAHRAAAEAARLLAKVSAREEGADTP